MSAKNKNEPIEEHQMKSKISTVSPHLSSLED
jgi:hypothetical protein